MTHPLHRLTRLAAALLVVAFALPAAATEFRSSDVHPDDYPTVQAVRFMSEQLKKKTNGKHTIKVYNQSQLGDEKAVIALTKTGEVDLVRVNVAPMNGICPETMIPTMPFLFRSKEHMRKVLDGPVGDEILKACESKGYVGLAFYDSGSRSLYTVNKPIQKISDAAGLKVRVQQSDLWISLLQAMGANATPMAYGEVYGALRQAKIDAAENNWPSYDSAKHMEVAKNYSMTEHSMAPEILVMSKVVWDKLSADEQKAIREAAKESVPFMRKLWDEKEARSKIAAVSAGIQVYEVDKKGFQDAMKPVYDKFITDPKMKDMIKRVQETQ